MHNNQEGFKKAELILQYLRNELTTEEELEFYKWLEEDIEHKAFFNKIISEEGLKEELSLFVLANKDLAWNEFKTKIEPEERPDFWLRRPVWRYIAIAATVCLICFGIFYKQESDKAPDMISSYKNDVQSGGNKAMLILADGKKISLDEAANGKLAQQDNMVISKTAAGQIVFDLKNTAGNEQKKQYTNPDAYNTITTPRGGEYMLILPDGSKVWLNAASSLRFPVSFTAEERKVVLKGEAYFEVHRNKSAPFKVITGDVEVKVLGTHFNIMAYPDEASIKTTLLEGAVKISKQQMEKTLKPGEQATITNGIEVGPANPEAVAWKDGFTSFKDADIETIMRAVARWYDIEVNYKGKVTRKLFTGSVSRGANLSEVLNSLQYLGGAQFKIEGRGVTISF